MNRSFLTLMSAAMVCFLILGILASCATPVSTEGNQDGTYLLSMPSDKSGIPGVTVELRALYDRNNNFVGYRLDDAERAVVCYTLGTTSISCVKK